MPAAAAAVVVGSLASGAAAAIVGGSFLAAFAGSMILGAISYALTPKPKKPAFSQEARGSNVAVRQSDLSRLNVYGHTRVTRGYAHMQSTGLNGTLHMILILCEGPLRAINEIWVNDYCIPVDAMDAGGKVIAGRYKDYMRIRKHLGTEFQSADSMAVSNMSIWTTDHRLQGVAYLYIIMEKNQDIFPTGIPNFTAIVEGPEVYDPRTDSMVWTTNRALQCRDFITNSTYGFAAAEEDVDDVNIAAQANICDEYVDIEEQSWKVTTIDITKNVIRTGTTGGEVLELLFADRVRIESTGSIPGGLSADTDYYVIPYQIKGVTRFGLAVSMQDAFDKNFIDIESVGSGTITVVKTGELRYHGSGLFDSEDEPSSILNNLASGMAGRTICIGGFWTLLAGAWRTPSMTLGLSDVRSAINFRNALSISDSFNEIKGLFLSPKTFYQTTDYPAARYEQFIDDDGGVLSSKDLALPFTNSSTTATRIAKIELFRGRQGIVCDATFSTRALQLQPGDTVYLNIPEYGWNSKVFEITNFAFDINAGDIVVKLNLRETAQAIYDWSQGEAIGFDPAPNTDLPSPYDVVAPTGVGYNSRVVETSGADQVYVMGLQWDSHPDAFVQQFGDFELQFKKSSDLDWLPSFFVDGQIIQSDLFSSSVGVPYDLRIRARNNLGVRSAWVTILSAVVGSSGGVGSTDDWETFSDPVIYTEDWETFSDPVGSGLVEDWGYFT